MTLIVEDGTGRADAESYVSAADVSLYARSRNLVLLPDNDDALEAACRVATEYLDNTYQFAYQGQRTRGGDQGLEWPRNGVFYSGVSLPADKLPKQLKSAACEAAIRHCAKPGALTPDIAAGANITSLTADSVAVQFGGGGLRAGVKSFPVIAMLMTPLLQQCNPYTGSTGRG